MFRLTACLILLPAGLTARPVSDLPKGIDIPRFQLVAEGLYRGGQPDKRGFEFLKEKGIKTVINFRTENDEAEVVKTLGMNYVWIPMSIQPWSKISDGAIAKYFEVVNNPGNYPIFFHCRRGADRTGAMAAFYRIAVQGWDAAKAYTEARHIGMRWWYLATKHQLLDFRPAPASLRPVAQEP
jgi:protein tyrosine/serine phosphatase